MNSISKKRLVRACSGEKTDRVPFWFMRQAGRYLPEYRRIREKQKDFLQFCYSPELACEVTLQPIHRFGMDGAIIFSDILVVPHALGVDVRFEENIGPVLAPLRNKQALARLGVSKITAKLAPVYEALRLTKKSLPEETALIGFAGAPWTLACYVIEGKSSKDFSSVTSLAADDETFFSGLIHILEQAVIEHLLNQIDAGAEIIQLFDSWAGMADDRQYKEYIVAPARRIVAALKKKHPEIPVIGFPRQSGEKFATYASETAVDAVSFDGSVSLSWVKKHLQPLCVAQGALSNTLLAEDKTGMLREAKEIFSTLDKPFVFNLGHGILPHTPIENVQAISEFLRNQ